jgi:D-alanyl-D-alanine carboxypeptidase
MVIEYYPQFFVLSTNLLGYILIKEKQNQIDPRGSKTKIKFVNTKQNRLAKILSVLVPVCAFTVLLPLFEHQIEAQAVKTSTGMVLGAYTQNLDLNKEETDQPKADFNVVQIKFDQLNISAKSVLAYDLQTGKVLVSEGADQKLAIASLTKLMTSIVAMEDPNFNTPIVITSADHTSITPILGLKNGDRVMPMDLVKSMLVGSANDAAKAIGNHFPNNKDFVAAMNAKAVELGMTNTHFDNSTGFDTNTNYSTAEDLQKLLQYALTVLPYQDIWKDINYSFTSVDGHGSKIKNSNSLVVKNKNIHSIKTGYTPKALENMVVQAENETGNKIVVIVLGTTDRDGNMKKAVDYVFDSFEWK